MVLNFGFCGFNTSSSSGGGTVTGDIDYQNIINKPSINGVVLVGNKTTDNLKLAHESENYGIRGDYCTQYGIIDATLGLIKSIVATADLIISSGIVLRIPNKPNKITIASQETYSCESTNNFTLFYLDGGSYFEAEEVCWQVNEPNGTANSTAWWSPKEKTWKFKSNDTGNVFRAAAATPLCDVFMQDEVITRIDFMGYRLMNSVIYATQDYVTSLEADIDHCMSEVEENANNIGTYSNLKQDKADNSLTTDNKTVAGAINELKTKIDNMGGTNG